jgi:hypothetical protein
MGTLFYSSICIGSVRILNIFGIFDQVLLQKFICKLLNSEDFLKDSNFDYKIQGKCFLHYAFWLTIFSICMGCNKIHVLDRGSLECTVFGFTTYYSVVVCFSWLSKRFLFHFIDNPSLVTFLGVMSFDIFTTIW